MFLDDKTPIIYNAPQDWTTATIYFVHDLHYGSREFDRTKWIAMRKQIEGDEHALVVWIGDLMDNAIPNSKSDMFLQTAPPAEQKEWVAEQLKALADKTIAVVAGNHENNRSTKAAGLYPLYDACQFAGISEKYRDTYAFIDIGIGRRKGKKQWRYVGQVQHRAKDIKSVCSADYTDGIDFFASGHDHEAKDKPRAKLAYDSKNKIVAKRNIEVLNCGAFLEYGGYGAKSGYRPQSDKIYALIISGTSRRMETRGFYL